MEMPKVHQKMHLFYNHQGWKSHSDWHIVMEDVFDNLDSMSWTGQTTISKVDPDYKSGFYRLRRCSIIFFRCMLKWCLEEDGTINRDFVDILSDVETIVADAVRYILQYSGTAPAAHGDDFSANMDLLLPRMAKACQHVLSAESSPPNFKINKKSLEKYGEYIDKGKFFECYAPISTQIKRVGAIIKLVIHTTDKISRRDGRGILICLESLMDKAACHVFLGCWENSYSMYLSGPSNCNLESLLHDGMLKVSELLLDTSPEICTDEILEVYIDHIQEKLMQLLEDQDFGLTRPLVDQLKMLHRELKILVNFYMNCPPQLCTEGPNLVDVRVEFQTLARNIDSFIYSCFMTQNQDFNLVFVGQGEAKMSPGFRKLLASILKNWVMSLTSCTIIPLTGELLIQIMKHVQILSQMLRDYIIPNGPVRDQLKMLLHVLGTIVNFHMNYPPGYFVEPDEEPNVVDVKVEIRNVIRNIESFIYTLITQNEENEVADTAYAALCLGLRNLLSSIVKAWVMQITSCTNLPLTDEHLIRVMECVQRFLSRMLNVENIIPTGPERDQIEFLHHELGILVYCQINYLPELYAREGLNSVSVRVEVQNVVRNIASFIYSSLIIETKQDAATMICGLHNLLASILKAWAVQFMIDANLPFLDELEIQWKESIQRIMDGTLKYENSAVAVAGKHQSQTQDDSMGFLLHALFKYKPNHGSDKEKPCNVKIQVLVRMRAIASNIPSFFGNRTKENLGPTTSFLLSHLVEKFAHLKAQVMDTIFLILVCRLRQTTPRTDQLDFFNFLLDNMKELVSSGSDSNAVWKDELRTIHEALLLFRDFLQSIENDSITFLHHDICERVMNVACEAEHLIYSLYDRPYPASCMAIWISHFAQHVGLIKASVSEVFERKENDNEITIGFIGDKIHVSSQALIPTIDLMVGFEGEMLHIKQKLTASHHVKQLDVVSIIGMPGLGKTTLAKQVYEDRQIGDYFQVRAWCCVSNEYNKKDLLLTILCCIIELTDMIQKKNEAELSTLLHKQLKGRRYLVVMDDVWGIDAFEYLKVFLPDDTNGSRIMLTSRNKVIGLKAKHHSDLLELRVLTSNESWVLLSKKVYPKQECPLELCQVGKRIAENCRGLPLAVVVVAGLLAKSHKTREFWEQVAENLTSYMAHDSQTQGMAVLELSYKHLPRHLKPLFLYFGAFPEDTEVPIEKLIWLWIAEGFVRDDMFGSLEHQAELYLTDLIDRSFLMVAARRSDGRVKTCIIHDLLRDMCLLKAKKEHFLQQIKVSDDLPDPIFYQKRLSILLHRRKEGTPTHLISKGAPKRPFIAYEDLSTLSLAPPLYSFLFFNKNKSLPLWKEAVESVLCDLRLLRVLHFESTSLDANLCDDVKLLVHLRYISIRATWTSIPSSISKLWNLETLIIKGLRGEIEVPEEIWELVKLKHFHVNDRAKFSDPSDKSSSLENLETLSTPAIRRGEEVKLIRRLPNVRKLRCIFLESCPQLESPNHLASLKAIYTGIGRCPGPFVVPSTLKKLSLSKFRLKWEQVSMFQKLPELEILNLRIGAVDGESWNMDEEEEEGFLKLKVLKLESLNIKGWTACAENFPCLEKLVLKKCKQLKEIPNELGDINTLQKMEVLSCSNSAAISAKSIEKEQKDAGNESLEVHVYSPVNLGSFS